MKKHKQGFTLAELLIVVAIIAVLVGISIPIFVSAQERARESTDLANVRGAYAEVMVYALQDDKEPSGNVVYENGVWRATVDLVQKKNGWQSRIPISVGGITSGLNGGSNSDGTWIGFPSAGGKCTVSFKEGGAQSISWGMNFTEVLLDIVVTDSKLSSAYRNKTIKELLTTNSFPMLDSSGNTGRFYIDPIKSALGYSGSADFAYTVVPQAGASDIYTFYISTDASLKSSGTTTGREINVIGYVYDLNQNMIIKSGPEMKITTYGKEGREKMNYEEYRFE